jgi:hypothetical protein
LGAKLTGPRLVKAMEGVFEGTIVVSPPTAASTISWLDILQFAKAHPTDFHLGTSPSRGRVCQFLLKGLEVEIAEDDWRLIMSGALDRFRLAPLQPFEEDESAELATLEILEQRLNVLIKKADEVARKARQLNYHLSGRKAAIGARLARPGDGGFQSVNKRQNTNYDLRADLLQQFLSASTPIPPRTALPVSQPATPLGGPATATRHPPPPQLLSASNRPSPSAPEASPQIGGDDPSASYRPLITARIERLERGENIFPPCDRCRRLRSQCIKHLTACAGCTKKHAKCSWRTVTDPEIAWLRREEDTEPLGAAPAGAENLGAVAREALGQGAFGIVERAEGPAQEGMRSEPGREEAAGVRSRGSSIGA